MIKISDGPHPLPEGTTRSTANTFETNATPHAQQPGPNDTLVSDAASAGMFTSPPPSRAVSCEGDDLSHLLDEQVYPALFKRLDSAFPEFGFEDRGGKWIASNWPAHFPEPANDKRPDRLVVYADRPWWIKVHGHDGVRLLDYVNHGRKPTGPDFVAAVRKLAELAGVPFPERTLTPEAAERLRVREARRAALEAVASHAEETLWSPLGEAAREFVRSRGFTDDDAHNLRLGYYASVENVRAALVSKDADLVPCAQDAGVLWSKLEGYVIFPWADANGHALTLYGRWPVKVPPLKKDVEAWRQDRDKAVAAWEAKINAGAKIQWEEPRLPKTIALPGEGTKSSPLYFDRARRDGHRDLVLVEGVMDAALCQVRGDRRVIACVAAQLSGSQVKTLHRLGATSVTICLDPDEGGERGVISCVKSLAKAAITAYVAPPLPDGLDPDEFLIRDGIEGWRAHVGRACGGAAYVAGQHMKGVAAATEQVKRSKVDDLAKFVAALSGAWATVDIEEVIKIAARETGWPVEALRALFKAHRGRGLSPRYREDKATSALAEEEADLDAPARDEADDRTPRVAPAGRAENDDPRPRIEITAEINQMSDLLREALASDPHVRIYRRGSALTEIRKEDAGLAVVEVTSPRLTEVASQVAVWLKETREGLTQKPPYTPVLNAVLAYPGRTVHPLTALTTTPTLRVDGSIVSIPGYDERSGIYYAPTLTFPAILNNPSRDDAVAALKVLLEPFADFPFVAPSDRSCALALVLTVLARVAIDGCTPIFLVRSPTPGTGKGLLVDVAATIATGKAAPKIPEVHGEEEERKRLFALALEGPPLTVIDNVEKLLGSAALAAFATAREFKDRVLGHSVVRSAPVTTVIVATGNNVAVKGDLGRRVVPTDIDAKVARPDERTGFTHPDILGWCRDNRPLLVVAALTILRAYFVAGRPAADIRPFGSFEEWSALIRGALMWVGEADPVLGRERIRSSADPELEAFIAALAVWYEYHEDHALSLSQATKSDDPFLSPMRSALAALYKLGTADRLDLTQVGYAFRRRQNRPLGGFVLRNEGRGDKGVIWKVERLPPPPPGKGSEP